MNSDKLRDTKTGKQRFAVKATWDHTVLAFSPDGKTLACGWEDGTVKMLDAQTGEERATLQRHTKAIRALVFNRDGTILASVDDGDTIKLWYSDMESAPDAK